MRHFGAFGRKRLVVIGQGGFRVQTQVELVAPAEIEAGAAQRVVAQLGGRVALGQVSRVGGEFVGNDADFHVVPIGQAEMFLGRDVAEHRAAEPSDHGGANAAGDMIVTGGDVGGERPQRVEGGFAAFFQLLFHVHLDLVHRHVAGAFDHHLAIMFPGDLGEFAQGFEFGKLGAIVRVRNGAGAQAVTQREAHIIGSHDLADLAEVGVEEVFLVVRQAPFRHDRAAA